MSDNSRLVFDWNDASCGSAKAGLPECVLLDETLRDGLQSPAVVNPRVEDKIEILHLMEQLGVGAADIGLPGAGARAAQDVLAIAREIRDARLALEPMCAARTVIQDIEPIVRVTHQTGVPIEIYAFIGSSGFRMQAEDWQVEDLLRHVEAAVRFAVSEGLQVALVTEDTTRSQPEVLEKLFRAAIDLGARRICLCDTVGHATPDGTRALVRWTRALVQGIDPAVRVDWHGHNDRGLALANTMAAMDEGVDRVHGTALGIGERCGNTALDVLLVNLKLQGRWPRDASALVSYCEKVARACRVTIPFNHPVAGRDAFRTATGVHAAAICKAARKGDPVLADSVYSGIAAGWFGKHQRIEIGPMSGLSNVSHWLHVNGLVYDDELAHAILAHAKKSDRVLHDDEVSSLVFQRTQPGAEAVS